MQETRVRSLGWEDSLEKGMVTYSSILAWRIPWTEEPGELKSMGWQRVRHNRVTNTHTQQQNKTKQPSRPEIWRKIKLGPNASCVWKINCRRLSYLRKLFYSQWTWRLKCLYFLATYCKRRRPSRSSWQREQCLVPVAINTDLPRKEWFLWQPWKRLSGFFLCNGVGSNYLSDIFQMLAKLDGWRGPCG